MRSAAGADQRCGELNSSGHRPPGWLRAAASSHGRSTWFRCLARPVEAGSEQGAELPDRCVKCNAPAQAPKLKKKLSWHHPAIYLPILVALLIYFVVAMILRKTATVEIGLCEEHKSKHHRNMVVTVVLIGLGILGLVTALAVEDSNFILLGILLLLAGIIYGVAALRILTPAKIDERFAWLKGANKEYLDELPQFPGV